MSRRLTVWLLALALLAVLSASLMGALSGKPRAFWYPAYAALHDVADWVLWKFFVRRL